MSQLLKIDSAINAQLKSLSEKFEQTKRIHIPHFLEAKSAQLVYQSLDQQEDWNLAWNNEGKHTDMDYRGVMAWSADQKEKLAEIIHKQAEHEFQYHYAAVPIYDLYHSKNMPNHFFNTLYEFINSNETLETIRKITGFTDIRYADMQATRYSKGHFLTEHDDNVAGKNRLAAYVVNLTPEWRSDWGGALVFPGDGTNSESFYPKFNALNIFAVPQKHAVSIVSPFCPAHRYSLTGWFRY